MKRLLEVPPVRAGGSLDRGLVVGMTLVLAQLWASGAVRAQTAPRERISFNADWRFQKRDPHEDSTGLIYDVRPEVKDHRRDGRVDRSQSRVGRACGLHGDDPQPGGVMLQTVWLGSYVNKSELALQRVMRDSKSDVGIQGAIQEARLGHLLTGAFSGRTA